VVVLLELNELEKRMKAGEMGKAKQVCLRVQLKLGEAFGASRFVPISRAHLSGYNRFSGGAKIDFAKKIVGLGGNLEVPTTTNPTGRDISRWREFRVPEAFSKRCSELEEAYLELGAIPTWTCTPYSYSGIPVKGEQVAFAESNAIAFVNSVIGAKTERYGDLFEVCSAITGRVPYFGMHLEVNRTPGVLIKVKDIYPYSFSDNILFCLLGYEVGKICGSEIPLIEGIKSGVMREQLKNFSAAVAASGGVGLYHIKGVTPDIKSKELTRNYRDSGKVYSITGKDLQKRHMELKSVESGKLDLVLLGCPHFSSSEFMRLNELIYNREISPGVEFWVQTNREEYYLIKEMGILSRLLSAGIKISTDTCMFNWPMDNWDFERVVTDSAKFAHYAPNELGVRTSLLDLESCVQAAVTGRCEG